MSEVSTIAAAKLKQAGLSGSDVREAFFEKVSEGEHHFFKCKECGGKYKSKHGNSNLLSHVTSHPEWLQKIMAAKSRGGPLDHFVERKCSPKAINLYRWIEQCVMNDEPFDFVENPYVKKNSRNESISTETLVKYLELLFTKVEEKLKAKINAVTPKRFGLIFDSWTCNSEHYTAVFLTWTDKHGTIQTFHICCGVQDESEGDEMVFTAEAMGDYFVDSLQIVGLDLFQHIDFVCGDNCAVNQRFADLISIKIQDEHGLENGWKVPLVGCSSHRLNLAREAFYNTAENKVVIEKVDQLMTKLRTLKNSAKLRRFTRYRAENQNATRWTSVNAALAKFKILEPFLPQCAFEVQTLQYIPNAIESNRIAAILASDQAFFSASNALQRGGDKQLELVHVRSLFDKLIRQHPDCREHLRADAEIVHSTNFESAVCKVQALDERLLNSNEKKAIKRFLISPRDPDGASESESENDHTDDDWAQDIIDDTNARKRRKLIVSKYRPMQHISPTSNVCERLFSRAKLIMRPHRKMMSPYHLEMLIFLRCNKELWDATTVEECLKDPTAGAADAAAVATEATA
jgi:hypothetical protein